MKALFKALFDKLLYSNLLIATSCAVFATEIFYLSARSISYPFIYLCFYGTLAHYGLHRLIGIQLGASQFHLDRAQKILRHRNLILLLSVLSTIIVIAFFVFYFRNQILFFAFPLLIALLYSIPILGRRIRDFHYTKIFWVASIWAYVTTILPMLIFALDTCLALLLFLEHLLFIFVITMPFDLRDRETDLNAGVRTIANQLSAKQVQRIISVTLISLQILVFAGYYWGHFSRITAMGLFLFYFLIFFLVKDDKRKKRQDWYYLFLLDGTIILHGSLIFLLS